MLELFQSVLVVALPLLGTAGASMLVWVLRTKFKLQITAQQEQVMTNIISKAIGFADEWAHQQRKTPQGMPTGAEKLAKAVTFARTELVRSGIKVSDEQIRFMLEALLGMMRPRA